MACSSVRASSSCGTQRAGDAQAIGADQHQQHALGAAEMRCCVDQRRVQGVAVAKCVQAQAGVDQALNEFARRRRSCAPCWSPPEPWPAGRSKVDRRPGVNCLGGLTSTPVGGGVLRLDRVRLLCSCSPCLANGCLKRRWVDVRYGPVETPGAPASPQMSHSLARLGNPTLSRAAGRAQGGLRVGVRGSPTQHSVLRKSWPIDS